MKELYEDNSSNQGKFPELQTFSDIRKKPSIFLFTNGEQLNKEQHALKIRNILRGKFLEEIDLVVNSGGGDIGAAYLIAQMLQTHAHKINACVPYCAKSAATLICVSADEILLGEMAELGPLDAQIYVSEKEAYISALNPLKSLEELRKFSQNTLIEVVNLLVNSGLNLDESFRLSVEFVKGVNETLFDRFDSHNLGGFYRSLSTGEKYGNQILKRSNHWSDDEKIQKVIEHLVYDYPSHDYIIDYHELSEMGFQVRFFSPEEQDVVTSLSNVCLNGGESIIEYREPQDRRLMTSNGPSELNSSVNADIPQLLPQ